MSWISGEMVVAYDKHHVDQHIFLQQLHSFYNQMHTILTSSHEDKVVYFATELRFCSHVFVRDDTIRHPLKAPYDGPYQVLERHSKTYTILVKSRRIEISVGRLKPTYLSNQDIALMKRSKEKKSDFGMTCRTIQLEGGWCSVIGSHEHNGL